MASESPSVSPIAEATVRVLHDAAMRQADEMLAERKANDVVAAQVSAVMAFESELSALRRAHDKRVSTATRAILLKSLYELGIEAFCPEARESLAQRSDDRRADVPSGTDAEAELAETTLAIDTILAEHGLDMDATADRVEHRVRDLIQQLAARAVPLSGASDTTSEEPR